MEWMRSNSMPYVADANSSVHSWVSKRKELISTLHLLLKFARESHVHVPLLFTTTQVLNISVWPARRTLWPSLQSNKYKDDGIYKTLFDVKDDRYAAKHSLHFRGSDDLNQYAFVDHMEKIKMSLCLFVSLCRSNGAVNRAVNHKITKKYGKSKIYVARKDLKLSVSKPRVLINSN